MKPKTFWPDNSLPWLLLLLPIWGLLIHYFVDKKEFGEYAFLMAGIILFWLINLYVRRLAVTEEFIEGPSGLIARKTMIPRSSVRFDQKTGEGMRCTRIGVFPYIKRSLIIRDEKSSKKISVSSFFYNLSTLEEIKTRLENPDLFQ